VSGNFNGSNGRHGNNGKAKSNNHGNLENNQRSKPSHKSHNSNKSHNAQTPHNAQAPNSTILPPRGDYKTLLSYQKSDVVYQITFRFCQRFLKRGDRTIDQMVQAARSGKQNIVEGSKAATTSKEMEIKLTNVARASLEELLEDYRDYLKARDLAVWEKDSKEALYARTLGKNAPATYEIYREFVETRPAETVANIAICLIHQANYLLDRQLKSLENNFLKEGGLRERMTRARLQARDQQRNGRWKA